MFYISEYNRNSRRFKVCEDITERTKLFSYAELCNFVRSGRKVYGITSTVWFIPVCSTKNSNTEVVFTFEILNVNNDWRGLVPDIQDDFFRVDVTVDNCIVIDKDFYYTYPSNDCFSITSGVDDYFKKYIEFYAIGLYQRSSSSKSKRQGKDYEFLSRQFAEQYGIVKYRVNGNLMIYNVSYPAYLSNPRYTIQHTVNLDTGEDCTRQLKRFDTSGLQNRG